MLLWLGDWLAQYHSGFGVVNYLTLRAILAVITALMVSLLLGPVVIRKLREYQIGQAIRELGPKSHFACLTASINGNDSISPTHPPISVITTSYFPSSPSL